MDNRNAAENIVNNFNVYALESKMTRVRPHRIYRGMPVETPLTHVQNIIDELERKAKTNGDRLLFTEIKGQVATKSWTYLQFWNSVQICAEKIRSHVGSLVDGNIAILPDHSVESLIAIFGAILAGNTAVLINPDAGAERIDQQLQAVAPRLIIHAPQVVTLGKFPVISLRSLLNEHVEISVIPCRSMQGPCLIFFTTGTTASSKPVIQGHYAAYLNAYALHKRAGFAMHDVVLCVLPFFYANSIGLTIFSSIIAGAHVILPTSFDPLRFFSICQVANVTIASVVPSILDALLSDRRQTSPHSLRYFISAAAALSQRTANQAFERWRVRILQGYGLSETINFSTLISPDLSDAEYQRAVLDHEIPSVGSELFGVEVAILDEHGNQLPDLVTGEVCMRGHSVMDCYLGNELDTELAFQGGWFHSGDIGYFESLSRTKEIHRILRLTGRIKNIAKINGMAISLEEIDRFLLGIEGVIDAVSLEIEFSGRTGICCVLSMHADAEKQNPEIRLKEYFPFLNDLQVYHVSEIHRTSNGKVNRSALKKKILELR